MNWSGKILPICDVVPMSFDTDNEANHRLTRAQASDVASYISRPNLFFVKVSAYSSGPQLA